MPNLQEVWADAWREKHGLNQGWIVNLDPASDSSPLGAVGQVRDDQFAYDATLETRGVVGMQLKPDTHDAELPWQFQSNQLISVNTALHAKSTGPLGAVGPASIDIDVIFGASEGATIYGMTQWRIGFADIGELRTRLVDAAQRKMLHPGDSIIAEQHLTGRGVIFSAREKNASLSLSAEADVSIGGATPPIASLSGKFALKSQSGAAGFNSFPDGAVLASRVLYLGQRGWLWWRRFEVWGAVEGGTEQAEEVLMDPVEGEADNQYFALV